MKWYYESDGKPSAPISEPELRALLADGKLSRHTLVWRKGMLDWQPAHQALDLDSALPAQTPLDPFPTPLYPSEEPLPTSTPAWENPGQRSQLQAFFDTLLQVLTQTKHTFQNLSPSPDWLRPLSFYILNFLLASSMSWLLLRFTPPEKQLESFLRIFSSFGSNPAIPSLPQTESLQTLQLFVSLLFAGIAGPILAILQSALLHAGLWICGGAQKPFHFTLKATCYGDGSLALISCLSPFVMAVGTLAQEPSIVSAAAELSGIIVLLAQLILKVASLSYAHSISFPRCILAILTSLMLFAGICTLLFIGLFAVFKNALPL